MIRQGKAPSSAAVLARRLQPLHAEFGRDPLTVSDEQLRRHLDDLTMRGLAPTSAKAERGALRALYVWADQSGLRPLSPSTFTVAGDTISSEWKLALAHFDTDQRARGFTDATRLQRQKYLRRLARAAGQGPWAMTHAEVFDWLESLHVTDASFAAHRSAARSFYRWATSTGRVFADPMLIGYAGPVALAVPRVWETELAAWRSFLRAGGRAETSIATFLDVMRHFARQTAHRAPFDVSTDDIASWMGNKRWARETRRRNRQTLISFYRWAVTTERIASNPASAVPIVKAQQAHARPAETDELEAALRKAGPREALALRLAAELGMRRGEVARVHTRDVQGARGDRELVVLGKGSRIRRLPITDGLAAVLLDRPAGYLFPGGDGGHLSPRWLGRRVSQLLPAGITMHQLRHRFATLAYSLDRDLFAVQEALGHASPATTRGYVRVDRSSLRRLMEGVAS